MKAFIILFSLLAVSSAQYSSYSTAPPPPPPPPRTPPPMSYSPPPPPPPPRTPPPMAYNSYSPPAPPRTPPMTSYSYTTPAPRIPFEPIKIDFHDSGAYTPYAPASYSSYGYGSGSTTGQSLAVAPSGSGMQTGTSFGTSSGMFPSGMQSGGGAAPSGAFITSSSQRMPAAGQQQQQQAMAANFPSMAAPGQQQPLSMAVSPSSGMAPQRPMQMMANAPSFRPSPMQVSPMQGMRAPAPGMAPQAPMSMMPQGMRPQPFPAAPVRAPTTTFISSGAAPLGASRTIVASGFPSSFSPAIQRTTAFSSSSPSAALPLESGVTILPSGVHRTFISSSAPVGSSRTVVASGFPSPAAAFPAAGSSRTVVASGFPSSPAGPQRTTTFFSSPSAAAFPAAVSPASGVQRTTSFFSSSPGVPAAFSPAGAQRTATFFSSPSAALPLESGVTILPSGVHRTFISSLPQTERRTTVFSSAPGSSLPSAILPASPFSLPVPALALSPVGRERTTTILNTPSAGPQRTTTFISSAPQAAFPAAVSPAGVQRTTSFFSSSPGVPAAFAPGFPSAFAPAPGVQRTTTFSSSAPSAAFPAAAAFPGASRTVVASGFPSFSPAGVQRTTTFSSSSPSAAALPLESGVTTLPSGVQRTFISSSAPVGSSRTVVASGSPSAVSPLTQRTQTLISSSPSLPAAPAAPAIPIRSFHQDIENEGRDNNFRFESGNGITEVENTHVNLLNGQTASDSNNQQEQPAEVVKSGSISYTSPEGIPITLTYTADRTGFHPMGDHLPTPHPEIQEHLNRLMMMGPGAD